MPFKKKRYLIILLLSISSCSLFGEESYYHQQQVAYSRAKDGPGLTVPPPLTSNKLSDTYVIPPAQKNPPSIEAPPPPGSALDKESKKESKVQYEDTNKDTTS